MRFVSIDNITEGMIAGKPLYGASGHLLIQSGAPLTKTVITKLRTTGYFGLYIDDELSKGIDPVDVVSDASRREAKNALAKIMKSTAENKAKFFQGNFNEVSAALNQIIEEITSSETSIVNVVNMKNFDDYTYEHSVNVCVLACVIGIGMNMSHSDLRKLGLAAILHDVGKMFIEKEILNKHEMFSIEEFEEFKKHVFLGVEKLKLDQELPPTVTAAILQHHERFDGSGYPHEKIADEIAFEAQIISLVDVYDSITTNKPLNPPLTSVEAYEYIWESSGMAFNPELVEIFAKKIAPYPLGVQVLLSDGQIGIIFKNHEDNLLRPVVKLLPTTDNPEERFIDLNNDSTPYRITIEKIFM